MSHTPGPCDHNWHDGRVLRPNLGMIGAGAICNRCKVVIPWELVAAAPDLLAALSNLVANQDGAESVKNICFDEARAALARAKEERT